MVHLVGESGKGSTGWDLKEARGRPGKEPESHIPSRGSDVGKSSGSQLDVFDKANESLCDLGEESKGSCNTT